MRDWVECASQAEVNKAVENGDYVIVKKGYFEASGSAMVSASGSATVSAYGSATVSAYGSATVSAYGSATVSAYGSATVRASGSATVSASGSATVRASGSATVRASGSATVSAYDSATVSAYGSATVRASGSATVSASGSATVRAYDSATVSAYDSATVSASPFVAVHKHRGEPKITGGVLIEVPPLTNAKEFCAYYGIEPARGSVTLYKAVDQEFVSAHGASYKPGEKTTAPDWDPEPCCGYGLHFSPRAFMARKYSDGPRFVACKVKLSDIVVIDDIGTPDKVKAKACTVLHECDEDGVEFKAAVAA